jgi:NADPH:quinone reductase-like Zn-dependent oxidoreductase
VPGCDGAGVVLAVGSSVHEFQPGDRIVTYLAPKLAASAGDDAQAGFLDVFPMLGQGTDGTLRSHAVFDENALVHAPKSLEYLPAATLSCTWLTAWNSLFGVKGREAGPGTWVLVQGTGGVSIAALQLAAASGATVVATTSTEEKATRLKKIGASHIVNYRTSPEIWGQEARKLTPDGRGFDIVIDIGGNETLKQSLASVRVDGLVLVVGGIGADAEPVQLFSVLLHTCMVRGILGGSRNHLKQVVKFIDEKSIVPAVDDVVFELAEAKEAYHRLQDKKHFSKVLIRVDHADE